MFSGSALREAIRHAKSSPDAIRLILQTNQFVSIADVDYHDGERYPVLVRIEGTPAYLDSITKPLTESRTDATRH